MDRCVRCIMPGTAKGIELDKDGLCQLCREYKKFEPRGEEALRQEIAPHLAVKGDFNCIVPISGGRDSSYILYYTVKVLDLKPLAVHNDNDFETETANRNLEAATRKLGVPLIRVNSKEHLARKIVAEKFNMNAPFGAHLVVAQTCEACQLGFESAAYNIARKNGITLIFWGDSRDESTAPYHRLLAHPVPSTLRRVLSPYVFSLLAYKYHAYCFEREYGPHSAAGLKEIHLYDYVRWDQRLIVATIQKELDWSVPADSPTTWRVDCTLVPVVNYLTEKAYGVSKIELGFSNMIRSGKMDRGDALRRAELIKKNTNLSSMKSFLSDMGVAGDAIEKALQ